MVLVDVMYLPFNVNKKSIFPFMVAFCCQPINCGGKAVIRLSRSLFSALTFKSISYPFSRKSNLPLNCTGNLLISKSFF